MLTDGMIKKFSLQNSILNNLKILTRCAIPAVICLSGCYLENADVSPKEAPANSQPAAIRVSGLEINASEPALAADESGNVYSVYVEHNDDKSADVHLRKFDSSGKAVGEKVRVKPEKGQAKTWFGDPPTIQVGKDGAVYIGWTAKFKNKEKPNANILYLSVSRMAAQISLRPCKSMTMPRPPRTECIRWRLPEIITFIWRGWTNAI